MDHKSDFPIPLVEKLLAYILGLGFWIFFNYKTFIFSQGQLNKYQNINGLEDSFFGFKRDFSDKQWNHYRKSLPLILVFFSFFVYLSYIIKKCSNNRTLLKAYYLIIGLGFAIYLHGPKVLFLFKILLINYLITIYVKQTYLLTFLIWVNCCCLKGLSEIYRGFSLSILGISVDESCSVEWHSSFNLVLLRVISFAMEYKEVRLLKTKTDDSLPKNKEMLNPCDNCLQQNYCQKYLLYVDVSASEFTLVNFLIYVFYPPLYFSGPTITFNSFIFQLNTQSKAQFSKDKLMYFLRLIVIFITLELYNHLIYPHAFLTNSYNEWMLLDFDNLTLTMMLYQNLVFIWLKFIFIWRSARFFALIDNIETEENMNRCVYNNYNFEGFWRAWHRSFNQWLIKYIFIPLGGNKYKFINIWVVFTFVALWHDLEVKLLVWAWFICIFLIPEIVGKMVVQKYRRFNNYFWFRLIQYIAGGSYIVLLMTSNIIGFGTGHVKLLEIIHDNLKSYTLFNWLLIVGFLSFHTCIQFDIREREKSLNRNLNY